jgi:uncharacterized membrane protein
MSVSAILLAILCQVLVVPGQVMLKIGLTRRKHRVAFIVGAILFMMAWFFIWLGLMAFYDLSKLYPFEGLNPALMAVSSWLILKEHMPASAWVGMGLVCVGIIIVAGS